MLPLLLLQAEVDALEQQLFSIAGRPFNLDSPKECSAVIFDELGLKKLPTIKSLRAEYAELLSAKKTAYPNYQTARKEMKELTMAKANIDRILEKTDRVDEKKPEHGRQ